jgi:hypothetical protein
LRMEDIDKKEKEEEIEDEKLFQEFFGKKQ